MEAYHDYQYWYDLNEQQAEPEWAVRQTKQDHQIHNRFLDLLRLLPLPIGQTKMLLGANSED